MGSFRYVVLTEPEAISLLIDLTEACCEPRRSRFRSAFNSAMGSKLLESLSLLLLLLDFLAGLRVFFFFVFFPEL